MIASPMVASLSDSEIHAVIARVVAGHFADADRTVIRVRSDDDFEGQPSISVIMTFPNDVVLPTGDARAQLQSAVGKALLALGEGRFPYMRLLHVADEAELAALDGEPPNA